MSAEVIHGDCLDVLRGMADASVDAVVTDPPYGTGQWQRSASGAGRDPSATFKKEEWDLFDLAWLGEALRVSRGPVLFFYPTPTLPDVLPAIKASGEPWRLMVWCKPDPRPRAGKQVAYGFEEIVAMRGLQRVGGKDYFIASSPKVAEKGISKRHPHQKPLPLMSWLVQVAAPTGGTILDPFAGSGTTLVAALTEGRRAIGIEREAQYVEIARQRIAAASTTTHNRPQLDG